MFANVIVFTPTNPKIPYFTYKIPKNLEKKVVLGQLVLVPWGKKNTQGVIFSFSQKTDLKNPKELGQILLTSPVVKPTQIELLSWLSWYYHAPLQDCLKTMLLFLSNTKRLTTIAKYHIPLKSLSRSALNIKQTIILVPTINQIPEILATLPKRSQVALYHHQLKPGELFNNWLKIYSGEVDFVVGSRSAIFAPVPNLKKITIYAEHDSTYKDERSPYYHAKKVAEKLTDVTGCKLEIIDLVPSVATFFEAGKAKSSFKLKLAKPKNIAQVEIVDMEQERRLQNFSPISEDLASEIKKTPKKGRILLYLNRKTEAGTAFCLSCKTSGYFQTPPETCPNCKNPQIQFFSLNLSKVANEVKKLTPTVEPEIIAANTKPKLTAKILLATSAIFYLPIPFRFDLVGLISADGILNLPDFAAAEKTFAVISQLAELTNPAGKLVIQTINPDHYAVKLAVEGNFKKFYQTELAERKALKFPPFSILAKLTIEGKNKDVTGWQAEDLSEKLRQVNPSIEILGPVPTIPLSRRVGGKTLTGYNIILKAAKREDLEPVLNLVPAGWKIDVEPDNLL